MRHGTFPEVIERGDGNHVVLGALEAGDVDHLVGISLKFWIENVDYRPISGWWRCDLVVLYAEGQRDGFGIGRGQGNGDAALAEPGSTDDKWRISWRVQICCQSETFHSLEP